MINFVLETIRDFFKGNFLMFGTKHYAVIKDLINGGSIIAYDEDVVSESEIEKYEGEPFSFGGLREFLTKYEIVDLVDVFAYFFKNPLKGE